MIGRLAILFLLVSSSAVKASERPNIVLFFVDDLGWNNLGYRNPDLFETRIAGGFERAAFKTSRDAIAMGSFGTGVLSKQQPPRSIQNAW